MGTFWFDPAKEPDFTMPMQPCIEELTIEDVMYCINRDTFFENANIAATEGIYFTDPELGDDPLGCWHGRNE